MRVTSARRPHGVGRATMSTARVPSQVIARPSVVRRWYGGFGAQMRTGGRLAGKHSCANGRTARRHLRPVLRTGVFAFLSTRPQLCGEGARAHLTRRCVPLAAGMFGCAPMNSTNDYTRDGDPHVCT